MPKNKNKKHRNFIYNRDKFTCQHCNLVFDVPYYWDGESAILQDGEFLEIDHVIPLAKGGSDSLDNKQALCRKCNNKKGSKI